MAYYKGACCCTELSARSLTRANPPQFIMAPASTRDVVFMPVRGKAGKKRKAEVALARKAEATGYYGAKTATIFTPVASASGSNPVFHEALFTIPSLFQPPPVLPFPLPPDCFMWLREEDRPPLGEYDATPYVASAGETTTPASSSSEVSSAFLVFAQH
jgi:hypothetical protein